MNNLMKGGMLALAATLASHGPVQAQTPSSHDDVVIGVIDTRVERGFQGIQVEYRHFGVQGHREGVDRVSSRSSHGDLIVESIADARSAMRDGRPYRVFVANPFVERPEGGLRINWKGLQEALRWFKENDVKVISTTFATEQETPGMTAFAKAAQEAGMVVVASVGNGGANRVPYPASYPNTIAVDGWYYRQKADIDKAGITERIDAVFDGSTRARRNRDAAMTGAEGLTPGSTGGGMVRGSSFAVARATAYIAASLGRNVDEQSAKEFIRSVSTPRIPVTINPIVSDVNNRIASKGTAQSPIVLATITGRGEGR